MANFVFILFPKTKWYFGGGGAQCCQDTLWQAQYKLDPCSPDLLQVICPQKREKTFSRDRPLWTKGEKEMHSCKFNKVRVNKLKSLYENRPSIKHRKAGSKALQISSQAIVMDEIHLILIKEEKQTSRYSRRKACDSDPCQVRVQMIVQLLWWQSEGQVNVKSLSLSCARKHTHTHKARTRQQAQTRRKNTPPRTCV